MIRTIYIYFAFGSFFPYSGRKLRISFSMLNRHFRWYGRTYYYFSCIPLVTYLNIYLFLFCFVFSFVLFLCLMHSRKEHLSFVLLHPSYRTPKMFSCLFFLFTLFLCFVHSRTDNFTISSVHSVHSVDFRDLQVPLSWQSLISQ